MIKKKRKKRKINTKTFYKPQNLLLPFEIIFHIKKLIVQYLITEYRILFMKYMAGQKSSYYVIKMCNSNKIQVAI